jgi:hypothetical protein
MATTEQTEAAIMINVPNGIVTLLSLPALICGHKC